MRNPVAFFGGLTCLLVTDVLDMFHPLLLKGIIDRLVGDQSITEQLLTFLALMMGVAFFRWGWRILFGRLQHRVAHELRCALVDHLLKLGPTYHSRHPVGATMSVLAQDVNAFRMGVGPGVLILMDGVFLTAAVIPLMISISWDWTWKSLIFVPFVPILIQRVNRIIQKRFRKQQDKLAELSGVVQELVAGQRLIKSFGSAQHLARYFGEFTESYRQACNSTARVDSAFHPIMDFTVASGYVILLYVGSSDVIQGSLTIGSLYAFHRYISRLMWPVTALGLGVSMIQQARGSMERIQDVLKAQPDILDGTQTLKSDAREVVVQGLSMDHPNNQPSKSLSDVSFRWKRGEILGLTGPIGSGKSLLLQALIRLRPVTPESIQIDGVPIDRCTRSDLRRQIGWVSQESILFSETVWDNLTIGLTPCPPRERVQEILDVTCIRQEIEKLPKGLDTQLGERGVNLSGGQKQRLQLARSLLREYPFLLIDDALSAVDVETEAEIVRRMQRWQKQGPGILWVSHRLATLRLASRILVLNEGRLEADAPLHEALQNSATLRLMHSLQTEGGRT